MNIFLFNINIFLKSFDRNNVLYTKDDRFLGISYNIKLQNLTSFLFRKNNSLYKSIIISLRSKEIRYYYQLSIKCIEQKRAHVILTNQIENRRQLINILS